MRHYLLLLIAGFIVSLTSCRSDFEFEPSSGGLGFSKDTVYLDTVFTNIGSSTYTLKVYNNSDKDIKIPTLQLGQGEDSKYRLMVDGLPGRVFHDIELLANDSMFVFIETTIDYNEFVNQENTFLYTDRIEFHNSAGTPQLVELVTLVQDAVFLYPQRDDSGNYESIPVSETDNTPIYGFNLSHSEHNDEFIWTNTKPYVIYGYAAVPTGETLTVNPGARVHFHANSGVIVRNGAVINIGNETDAATDENFVVFEGDRLEPDFSDIPGQWGALWMQEGSSGNLNNAIIKNATVGIIAEGHDNTPQTLKLRNVQIYNNSNIGILARNGHIYGENVVINMAGEASLAATLGGIYTFKHCTFANYFNSFNQVPVLITDNQETPDAILVADMDASFENCILYGSSSLGFLLDRRDESDSTAFNYKFTNSFIKFVDNTNRFRNNPLYDFDNPLLFEDCLIAENSTTLKPEYEDPENNKLNISDESAANGIGSTTVAAQVPFDIKNTARSTTAPDAGAYESVAFSED